MLALFCLLLSGALGALSGVADDRKPTLFVFLTTSLTSHALQKALESELPRMSVTAFGRSHDFEDALTNSPPDAVLALRPVLAAHGLRPSLQGYRAGSATEPYVLVSVGRPIDRAAMSDKVVGVVDLLGRKGTTAFVGSLFGSSAPRIKRVVKPEDLLFLLQLKMADAIFASTSVFEQLKRGSELDLQATKVEGAELGLPAVAFLTDVGRNQAGASIPSLSSDLAQQIGVGSWKAE
jgi:hypothetical protein